MQTELKTERTETPNSNSAQIEAELNLNRTWTETESTQIISKLNLNITESRPKLCQTISSSQWWFDRSLLLAEFWKPKAGFSINTLCSRRSFMINYPNLSLRYSATAVSVKLMKDRNLRSLGNAFPYVISYYRIALRASPKLRNQKRRRENYAVVKRFGMNLVLF